MGRCQKGTQFANIDRGPCCTVFEMVEPRIFNIRSAEPIVVVRRSHFGRREIGKSRQFGGYYHLCASWKNSRGRWVAAECTASGARQKFITQAIGVIVRRIEKFTDFSGWEELGIFDWVKYVCTTTPISPEYDIEKSPDFAIAVLTTTSKHWDSIPQEDRTNIISMLKNKKCMPTTKKELLKPGETYFHNVKVLPDLPLVESIKGVKEKFLEQLGVRRVVALQLIFDRLGEGGDWSHIDGIKYLASVQKY